MPGRLGDVSLNGWKSASSGPTGTHCLPPQEGWFTPSPQTEEGEGELGREEQSWNGQCPMKGRHDSECLYTPRLRPQMGWVFLSPRWPLAYCPGCFPSWKLLLEEKKETRGGASCDVWKLSFPRLHLLLPLTTTALWPASDHGLFFLPSFLNVICSVIN